LLKLVRIFIVKVSLLRVTVCHFDCILHLAWGLLSSCWFIRIVDAFCICLKTLGLLHF